jgi:hypothetical protein
MLLRVAPSRLSRLLVALLATLLVLPVAQLLGAAPAHAAPNTAQGAVYDGLGDPLAGVAVKAYPGPNFNVAGPSTTTNAEGAYSLGGLAAGSYKLEFSKTDFQTTRYGGGQGTTLVVDGDGDITVGGEPVEDNVLDDVTLTSTATHPVSGLVTDGAAPLDGIAVAAHPASNPDADTDTATTGTDGSYALDLPAGTYTIEYTDPGQQYLPTSYDGGAGDPVELTVGTDGSLLANGAATGCASLCTVALAPVPADAEFPIAGDVVDANGEPVAGVTVSVDPVGASTDSGTGSTNAEGTYSVSVRPGTYHVSFARTGFSTAPYTGDGGTAQATVTVGATGGLTVDPAEELTDNRLNTTTLKSGLHAVGGKVVKAVGGQDLPGITVRAFPEGDQSEAVDTATTNATGVYGLSLPIGTYDLVFVDEDGDGTDYVLKSLPFPVKVGQGGVLTYNGATVTTLPNVEMSEAPADATYDVSGVVADVNGDGINGVEVTADAIAPTPTDQDVTVTTASAGGGPGSYTLALEAGTYQISFDGGIHFGDTTYDGEGNTPATVTVGGNGVVSINGIPVPSSTTSS